MNYLHSGVASNKIASKTMEVESFYLNDKTFKVPKKLLFEVFEYKVGIS